MPDGSLWITGWAGWAHCVPRTTPGAAHDSGYAAANARRGACSDQTAERSCTYAHQHTAASQAASQL
jgi:hypothetical protein